MSRTARPGIRGQAPFGYMTAGGQHVPRTDEQHTLAVIRGLVDQGASDVEIAAHLNAAGLRPRAASVWGPGSVRSIRRADDLRRYLALDLTPEDLALVRDVLVRRVNGRRR